jgi:hypothetical protein
MFSEKHFNLVHESLLDIKERLRQLNQNQSSSTDSLETCEIPTEESLPIVPETTFQGESSFDSHSALASLSAEVSARGAENSSHGHDIYTSLSTLKSLLQNQARPSPADDLSFPITSKPTTAKVQLPPLAAVLAVLKRATSKFFL